MLSHCHSSRSMSNQLPACHGQLATQATQYNKQTPSWHTASWQCFMLSHCNSSHSMSNQPPSWHAASQLISWPDVHADCHLLLVVQSWHAASQLISWPYVHADCHLLLVVQAIRQSTTLVAYSTLSMLHAISWPLKPLNEQSTTSMTWPTSKSSKSIQQVNTPMSNQPPA